MIYPKEAISKSASKKIGAQTHEDEGSVKVRAYLIGQLGKNKAIEDNPINLRYLLAEIYGVINEARKLVGGRTIILECDNHDKLISHYERHNFTKIEMPPNHNGDVTMYTVIKS